MAMKTKAVAASLVQNGGRVSVYGIGTDDGMYYKIWDGDRSQPSRTGWLPLGGKFDSVPSVFAKNFQLAPWDGQAFGLGSNNEMFFRTVGNFTFPPPPQAWQPLGGIFNSPPTALSCGPEGAVKWAIVGLGTDNQPYLKLFDERANAWLPSIDGWFPLGGKLIYEMNFAVIGGATAQTIALFGVGTGRQMFMQTVDVSNWPPTLSGWNMLGGCFASPPAVAQWGPNRIDVFGLGMGLQMFHRAWENGNWLADWEFLGGVFNSAPAVVSPAPNVLDILGLGTDDGMYHKRWDGTKWLPSLTGWDSLGGVFTSAPTAISTQFQLLQIFGLGTDFQMYHKLWNGSQWMPPATGWEPLGGTFKIPRPTLLPALLDFEAPVTFSDGTPVGGSMHVSLFNNGTASFSGHLHDFGFPSYACSIACAVIDAANRAYTFQTVGNVFGTDLPGSRDHDWNMTAPPNASLRDNWADAFACGGARFGTKVTAETNPPGGLVNNVSEVLHDLAGSTSLTVIPLVGNGP